MTNWEQIAAEAAWVGNILGLMAFVAAAIAVAVTLSTNSAQQRTLELQRKQFEEQQRQARREQAAKVFFFVEANNDGQFELKVINASDYPIHGAIAVLAPRSPRATAAALITNLLPTGSRPYTMRWRRGVLPPRFTELDAERDVVFGVELWFEDSNGTYWRRNSYGKLVELTDAELRQLDDLVADDIPRPGRFSGGVGR